MHLPACNTCCWRGGHEGQAEHCNLCITLTQVLVPAAEGPAEVLTALAAKSWKENAYFFKVCHADLSWVSTTCSIQRWKHKRERCVTSLTPALAAAALAAAAAAADLWLEAKASLVSDAAIQGDEEGADAEDVEEVAAPSPAAAIGGPKKMRSENPDYQKQHHERCAQQTQGNDTLFEAAIVQCQRAFQHQ